GIRDGHVTGVQTCALPICHFRFRRLKPPQAEMARLAHNDYLQQASDSGLLGFIPFSLFVIASLWVLYRRSSSEPIRFAAWLSLRSEERRVGKECRSRCGL